MAGLLIRHPRPALGTLAALMLATGIGPSSRQAVAQSASQEALPAAVQAATVRLQRSWSADATTRPLPFPRIRLLPPGTGVDLACDPTATERRPAPTGRYCSTSREVLLDRDLLAQAYRNPNLGASVVAYWIATALAERLLDQGGRIAAPSATGILQANCLAGVLLGASAGPKPSRSHEALLFSARSAYGATYARAVGTGSQRIYALLSGIGATASSCSTVEMAALARGTVPDPGVLRQIEQLPPPDRAHSSLKNAIESQCREIKPNFPCPRSVASQRTGP